MKDNIRVMAKSRLLCLTIVMGILICLITLLFQTQLYRIFPRNYIDNKFKIELLKLGNEAVKSKDVPISSLLVYKDSIIGRGYNTVKKDKKLTGHAEINALNNAFHNLGDEFFSLDKSELKLYSTLEPCPMCKGVLVNQNIYNIYFEMDKSLLKRTKNTLKNLFYEFNKRGIKDENIQDSLINLYHRKNN